MVFGVGSTLATAEHYIAIAKAVEAEAIKLGGKQHLLGYVTQAEKIKADFVQLESDLRAFSEEAGVDFDAIVKDIQATK